MGVDSRCGEQEVGVVIRRYIDFLILLIPTPLVSVLFYSSIPTFCSFKKCFSFFIYSNRVYIQEVPILPYIRFKMRS